VFLFFIAGCSANDVANGRWSVTVEPPADVQEVIDAVSALPECGSLQGGGVIHWHAVDFLCMSIQVTGCAFPFEDPRRIEVVYRGSAWDSSLPHELCHLCGYTDEDNFTEVEACAYRARQARPPAPPLTGGTR
jgi:hypothetical protein